MLKNTLLSTGCSSRYNKIVEEFGDITDKKPKKINISKSRYN